VSDTATLDEPSSPPETGGINIPKALVVCFWVSEASRVRMAEGFPCTITEEIHRIPDADLLAVSTRVPRSRSLGLLDELRPQSDAPIVVVCHAGGEAVALDLMAAGAVAIVAEGNEAALKRFLGFEDAEEGLVHTFEHRMDRFRAGDASSRGRDRVTGLPGSSSFEVRLAELSQGGILPRVGFVRIIGMDEIARHLDAEVLHMVRRRLSMLFGDHARRNGAELFVLGDGEFALLSSEMSTARAQEVGFGFVEMAAAFTPVGGEPIRLAVGHAGPEVASDVRIARELAERSIEAATSLEQGGVVSAEDLTRQLASATELEAALRIAALVDELDEYPGSHSARVADYAGELATQLGYDGPEYVRIRLAATLHDIGKVGLSPAAVVGGDPALAETVAEFETHAERGARYAKVSAGPEVAGAIAAHHEHWDGTGFPEGLRGDEIPIASRILAVADCYDNWTNQLSSIGNRPALTMRDVVNKLAEEAGKQFDPTVVRAALELFGQAD
jgi:putative nucleotidyltransferase with HDIG domain